MNSFILFSLFYLIKICSFKTMKITCDQGEYYNSINHNCSKCGNDVLLYNNICYYNKKSVYGLPITFFPDTCDSDTFLTELDDKGNHLGYFMCAKTKLSYTGNINYINNNDVDDSNEFSFEVLINIKKPEAGSNQQTFKLKDFDRDEINYSIDACFNGTYEKSCQYLINLCTLSLYGHRKFCQLIEDLEKNTSM